MEHGLANDIPPDLAAAVAERFALRGVLGRGGMATVYLADDRKHHRVVALKVLRPELAASLGAERFLREIEIVAQLTHPHILALYDSGEARAATSTGATGTGGDQPGFLYYVMPYIEGGSLRQAMEPGQPMSADRALAIAAPVVDAVSYAHRMGVLHRDIKPENILFSQGHPIVADFGIAKAVTSASDTSHTRTGLSLGTPGYMSPEQAAGFRELNERTDVYALAVVMYEMLVGGMPENWPGEDAVRAGRFFEAPPEHGARLAALGANIEGALVRGLAVRFDQRTATPSQLLDELRGSAPAPAPLPARRRYRPDEVDEIVKRASELEATNPTASGAMTIGGVEEIAKQVGIAPALVRSAAKSVTERTAVGLDVPLEPTKRNAFIGGPTRVVVERTVAGELLEADFPVVVDEIRRAMRNVGQVSQLGRSFSWVMGRSGGSGIRRDLEVVVSVRGGRTRITVQESLGQMIGATFGGICGGMGGGGMGPIIGVSFGVLHLAPIALLAILPAWLATAFAVARTTYFYSSRRREAQLAGLMDRIEPLVRELISEASSR